MKKFVRLFLVAAAIFVAIMVAGVIVGRLGEASGGMPAQRNQSAPAEVPVSDIQWPTVDSIYNLHSNETDLSKDDKWKVFQGRRVKWTGTVTAVSNSLGSLTVQVKMNPDTLTSDLIVTLRDSQMEKALALKQGDPITFEATLDSWGTLLPISLKDGELMPAAVSVSQQVSNPQPDAQSSVPQDTPMAPQVAQGTTDSVSDPLAQAKARATENAIPALRQALPSIFHYEVVSADASDHDDALEPVGTLHYPILVIIRVRYLADGPREGFATFACDAQGNVIQPLSLPEP